MSKQITITVPDDYVAICNFGVGSEKEGNRETGHVQADPAKLTNAALLYLFEYGFQRAGNDRTGGSDKTLADKHEIAGKFIEWITAENFTKRVARESGSNPLLRYIRAVLRANMGAATKAEYKKIKDAGERDEFLDAKFDALDEATTAKVIASAEARKKIDDEAKAAQNAATVAIDI